VSLEKLRRELVRLHLELPRGGLVSWSSGNISARVGEEMYLIHI